MGEPRRAVIEAAVAEAPPGTVGVATVPEAGAVMAEAREETAGRRSPTAGERVATVVRYSRVPLLLLTACSALDQADRYLLSSVYPLLQEQFHLSDSQLGLVSSAMTIVGSLAVVPFGILVDRKLRTKIVSWAIAIWSTAVITTGLAGSYTQLFISRMFHGTAEAGYGPAAFSLIADYYPVEQRATSLAIFSIGSIGGFIILPFGAAVATIWGWRVAFHVYAIPGFLLALLVARMPEPARGVQDATFRELDSLEAGTQSAYAQLPTRQAWGKIIRIPTMLVLLFGSTLGTFFLSGLGIWTVTFFVRYHNMSVVTASSVVVITGVGAVVGSLSGGKLGDLLVNRGIGAGRIYAAAAAPLVGFALLFPAFAVGSTALCILLFAFGAVTLTFGTAPMGAVRAEVLHPDLRGRASSLFSLLSVVSGAGAPLLFGYLSDTIGLRATLLTTLPGFLAGGILLLLLGPRFYQRDAARMLRQLSGEELPVSPVLEVSK